MSWIDGQELAGITVEKVIGPRPDGAPFIPLTDPKAFIVHTTEGDTVDGAVATLRSRFFAPHFVVGQDRIVQMRPLDAQAATVHDWNSLGWQIECVGRANQQVSQLTPATWRPLVAVSRFVHHELGIPYDRPDGWHDDLSDITTILASNNTRRQSRRAIGFRGFLGHLDIPDQDPTWHWDPGALDYQQLFVDAQEDDMTPEQENDLKWVKGLRKFFEGGAEPAEPGPTRAGWRAGQAAISKPEPGTPAAHGHTGTVTVT